MNRVPTPTFFLSLTLLGLRATARVSSPHPLYPRTPLGRHFVVIVRAGVGWGPLRSPSYLSFRWCSSLSTKFQREGDRKGPHPSSPFPRLYYERPCFPSCHSRGGRGPGAGRGSPAGASSPPKTTITNPIINSIPSPTTTTTPHPPSP